VAVLANFSGIVVDLGPMAGEAKRPRIGASALGTLGMAIRAVRLMDLGIMGAGRGRGMARSA